MTDHVVEASSVAGEHHASEDGFEPAPWKIVGDELLDRTCVTLKRLLKEVHDQEPGAPDVDSVDDAVEAILDGRTESRDILVRSFTSAAERPQLAALLATYLYARQLMVWEETSRWDDIRRLIQVTRGSLESPAKGKLRERDPVELALVQALMGLMDAIDPAMRVESGLNCSCPITMRGAAGEVVDHAKSVLESLVGLDAGPHEACSVFVRGRATIDEEFFAAVGLVCDAVVEYAVGSSDVVTKMGEAIDAVKRAEDEGHLEGDVYASELRSHRIALETLSKAWPRIHADRATVSYCYPFAVSWADPVSLVEAANVHGNDWVFAGQRAKVEPLELTDMWNPPAAEDQSEFTGDRYTGVRVSFPEGPRVRTATDCLAFSLEIRLSCLGNHFLRFEQELENASIHELNQAMRRPMREMGAEEVTFGEKPDLKQFERLADLAGSLIDSLVKELEPRIERDEIGKHRLEHDTDHKHHKRHKHHTHARGDGMTGHPRHVQADERHGKGKPEAPKPKATAQQRARKANPHVILTARELSLEEPGGVVILPDFSSDDLWRDAKGAALLMQPVRQAAAVLEEWSRYDLPDRNDGNAMQPFAFHGNVSYRTTNTTFALLRGTPEFLIMEYEEAAEFVASLPVLLESWMSQIRRRASHDLDDNATSDQINERQLNLRKLLTKATAVIAEIRSSDLCRTAVHRKLLDDMFDTAGIERFERELQSQFEVLDAQFNTLSTMAARKEQKRLDKQSFFFGAGAVLVGVPSLAALFQLLDDGNSVRGGGWDNLEAAGLIAVMVLLAVFVLRLPGARDFLNGVRKPGDWLKTLFAKLRGRLHKAETSDGGTHGDPKGSR